MNLSVLFKLGFQSNKRRYVHVSDVFPSLGGGGGLGLGVYDPLWFGELFDTHRQAREPQVSLPLIWLI